MGKSKLVQIFSDIIGIEPELINESLTPGDIPSWDSFQHLNLVVAIEEEFNIFLEADEIEQMKGGFKEIKKVLIRKGVYDD